MRKVARIGDSSSHGGRITGCCSKTYAENKLVSCVGHTHYCPKVKPKNCKHNTGRIVQGSGTIIVENRKVSGIGHRIVGPCGCVCSITSGASKVYIGG
jgi:uncharacterized Zn-binding protein involved in type VI secretion